MEVFHFHQYLLEIKLIFIVVLFISFSAATTIPIAETQIKPQELHEELSGLTATVEILLKESKHKDQAIEVLQHQVSHLKSRIDMMSNQDEDKLKDVNQDQELKSLINIEKERNFELTHRIHKRVPELQPVKVAFHASVGLSIASQNNAFIIFDNVLVDTAHAYNNKTGVFTAPDSGVYVLTWTTSVYPHGWAHSCILVDGVCYGHTISNSDEFSNQHTTGIIVIHLSTGDCVNIQAGSSSNKGTLDTTYGMNSFSGWKLD